MLRSMLISERKRRGRDVLCLPESKSGTPVKHLNPAIMIVRLSASLPRSPRKTTGKHPKNSLRDLSPNSQTDLSADTKSEGMVLFCNLSEEPSKNTHPRHQEMSLTFLLYELFLKCGR